MKKIYIVLEYHMYAIAIDVKPKGAFTSQREAFKHIAKLKKVPIPRLYMVLETELNS